MIATSNSFLIYVSVPELLKGQACKETCGQGYCIQEKCRCNDGFTGVDCDQLLCGPGGGFCEKDLKCLENLCKGIFW